MLRKSKSPVALAFSRKGGSIILARVDIWKAKADDWVLVFTHEFRDPTQALESSSATLAKGTYAGVFQCFVQESLNGRYHFELAVGAKPTFADDGDVNTTPAKDDTKVFRDQFMLEVS